MIEYSTHSNENGISSITIDPTDKLICGYPTNFIKNKKNFYHPYHIVLLYILSKDKNVEAEQRKTLKKWAHKWYLDMKRIEHETKLSFFNPNKILKSLTKTHLNLNDLNIEEIIRHK
jgi:ABC-type microcin C transport system permease subunit YejE